MHRAEYGCTVIAIKTGNNLNISPMAEDTVRAGDMLLLIGSNDDIENLEKDYEPERTRDGTPTLTNIELIVNKLKNNMSPPQLIMMIFFTLIWIGAILLALPISSSTGIRSVYLMPC